MLHTQPAAVHKPDSSACTKRHVLPQSLSLVLWMYSLVVRGSNFDLTTATKHRHVGCGSRKGTYFHQRLFCFWTSAAYCFHYEQLYPNGVIIVRVYSLLSVRSWSMSQRRNVSTVCRLCLMAFDRVTFKVLHTRASVSLSCHVLQALPGSSVRIVMTEVSR